MSFLNDPLKVAADWLLGIFTGWGLPVTAALSLIGFLGVLAGPLAYAMSCWRYRDSGKSGGAEVSAWR